MKTHILAILLVFTLLLAACDTGTLPLPTATPVEIDEDWSMRISPTLDRVAVETQRQITLVGPEVVNLISGSLLLEPAKLERYFLEKGASHSLCVVEEDTAEIRIECRTTQEIRSVDGKAAVAIPGLAIFQPARLLASEVGTAVSINQRGEIELPLRAAGLPDGQHLAYGGDSYYQRRIRLRLPSTILVASQELLTAGTIASHPQETRPLILLLNYERPRSSWWLLAGALLAALFAVKVAFPIRAHIFSSHMSHAGDCAHLQGILQRAPAGVVAIIERWHAFWPGLLTNFLALSALISGFLLFLMAWILTPIESFLAGTKDKLAGDLDSLPLALPALELEWWLPTLLLLAGTGLMVLGAALLLRREWARLVLLNLLLALFLAWIIFWPDVLLRAPFFPGQTGISWLLGGLFGVVLSTVIYAMRHAQTRRLFQKDVA